MRLTLLALAFVAIPSVVLGAPPATGTTYTFHDPVFTGTVFCDTLSQVTEIATAERPSEVYLGYLQTPNELNEPTCAVIIPTGIVVDVKPLGVMREDGQYFNAWAVQTQVGEVTGYALYLEEFQIA